MYFGGTTILRGAGRKSIQQRFGCFFWLYINSTVSAVTLTFGQSPQNLVGVLSCPGVADMQTPLKSADMLQAIMYI